MWVSGPARKAVTFIQAIVFSCDINWLYCRSEPGLAVLPDKHCNRYGSRHNGLRVHNNSTSAIRKSCCQSMIHWHMRAFQAVFSVLWTNHRPPWSPSWITSTFKCNVSHQLLQKFGKNEPSNTRCGNMQVTQPQTRAQLSQRKGVMPLLDYSLYSALLRFSSFHNL